MILGLMLMGSCSTSHISKSWKSGSSVPGKYNKILVLGLIRDEDSSLQEKMERHMSGDLWKMGYYSVSSYQQYGSGAFDGMMEEEAIHRIKRDSIDAVLTIVLLDKDVERRYFAGHPRFWPLDYYDTKFWQYYAGMSRSIYEKDFYMINSRYLWESHFYDMKDQSLIYGVQTQSFDPENAERLAHEYGKTIVKNLVKKKVIVKQEAPVLKAF